MLRNKPGLIKVMQWMFPDTALFKGNIFDPLLIAFSNTLAVYAQHVLALFYPHRRQSDIIVDDGASFPHIQKLRIVHDLDSAQVCNEDKILFTNRNTAFLQNVQNG